MCGVSCYSYNSFGALIIQTVIYQTIVRVLKLIINTKKIWFELKITLKLHAITLKVSIENKSTKKTLYKLN